MSNTPALILKGTMAVQTSVENWSSTDPTDPYIDFPFKWSVQVYVDPMIHANPNTRTGYSYDAYDVQPGCWISGQLGGYVWKVVEATPSDSNNTVLVIEDVGHYNAFLDVNLSGGGPIDGEIIVFELNDRGLPILAGIQPNAFSDTFYGDLVSRFEFRNVAQDYVSVHQASHGLQKDDMIYMDNTGAYRALAANTANKLLLGQMVGQVTVVRNDDYFSFKARGEIRTNITLPADSVPGQLIYLDPLLPGKLTAIRPAKLATPVYIRLETANRGIYMGAGSGGGAVDEDELRFATVYRVANLAARAAIDPLKLKEGDQAYVADAGQGEWALYMVSRKTLEPVAITWTKIVDMDSSTVDGRTVSVSVNYDGLNPIDVYRISPTDRVTVVTVEVLVPFHPSATLTVGDDADHERLVQDQHIDLSVADTYTVTPSYQYGGTEESWIRAYLSRGTSTAGSAKVTISYI